MRFLFQFLLMFIIYLTGNLLTKLFHLPLPGSIVGMMLLFVALLTGICKVNWVDKVAELHLKHITLLFIPSIVGVLSYSGIFKTAGIKLAVILIISSLVVLTVTASVAELYEWIKERSKHGNIGQ